ncbi:MAG TPA: spore gernimation protein [Firmicutes bacterium]|nr:spore gernimation protein [Bacillota bacterium]
MFQDKEKVSGNQGLMLILAGGIGNIFVVLAVPAVQATGRDGWLPVLIAYILATVVGLALLDLGRRFPNQTFVQYLPVILGKFWGKLAGLAYVIGWLLMAPLIVREIVELIRFFLPFTPTLIIIILMALLAIYAMSKGFEVYARTAELFVVIMILLIIVILGLNFSNLTWKNLTPVLANGFGPVFKGLWIQFPYAMETILFMALWLPCLNKRREGRRAVLLGMPLAGILLTVLVAVNIAFTGTALTSRLIFPIFYMSSYIYIGNFLTGMEAVFMALWMISSYLEIMIFCYPSVVGLAQWLNLKKYQPLILPLMVIIIVLTMVPSNVIELMKLDTLKNPVILLPLSLLIPFTWIIAVIRKLDYS